MYSLVLVLTREFRSTLHCRDEEKEEVAEHLEKKLREKSLLPAFTTPERLSESAVVPFVKKAQDWEPRQVEALALAIARFRDEKDLPMAEAEFVANVSNSPLRVHPPLPRNP